MEARGASTLCSTHTHLSGRAGWRLRTQREAMSLSPSFCAYQTQTFLLTSDHKQPPRGGNLQNSNANSHVTTPDSQQAVFTYKNWKAKEWR